MKSSVIGAILSRSFIPLAYLASGFFSHVNTREADLTRFFSCYQHLAGGIEQNKKTFFDAAGDAILLVGTSKYETISSIVINDKKVFN